MEVLLLQDIQGVGKKNDLLVVGDGYALNFLLPQRKALIATPTVRRRYAELIRRRAEERMAEAAMQRGAVSVLAGKVISFDRKATKTGKLYAAITEKMVADALMEQHKTEVKPENVMIDSEIKALGEFEVKVKLGESDVAVTVKVGAEK